MHDTHAWECIPYDGDMRTLLILTALGTVALAGDKEWAPGVKYTTDWKAAIKEAHSTGKILFIYNGWQRAKV